jgi:hypothetical protein
LKRNFWKSSRRVFSAEAFGDVHALLEAKHSRARSGSLK